MTLMTSILLVLGMLIPLHLSAAIQPAQPAPQRPAAQRPTPQSSTSPSKSGAPTKTGGAGPSTPSTTTAGQPVPASAPAAGQPPAPAPAESAAPVGAGARQSELYGDRLDGLQKEVDDLKDKIFRSKARLSLLKETVLRGVLAGSRVILAHRNRMGSGFRLVKIVYILDGAQIYARTDDAGALDQEDELVIFDGNLPPGPHHATIELTYKGHGFGVFSYLTGYTFDSRSSHGFTAPENGAVKLVSVGFERGNMTTEMKDRPAVDWQPLPLDAAGRPVPKASKREK